MPKPIVNSEFPDWRDPPEPTGWGQKLAASSARTLALSELRLLYLRNQTNIPSEWAGGWQSRIRPQPVQSKLYFDP